MEKLDTPRGPGARSMTTLSPTTINVAFDQAGADWMGPRTPMLPVAPPEVAGRSWDFVPGYNLQTQPRAFEAVTFEALRNVSNAFDPLRLVIERRKDQMARLEWTIRPKHDGPGKRPTASALSPATRSLIRDVTEFFNSPDLEHSWRQWLRMLLEDHFVIDAPALYCERSREGQLLGLRPVDGALVKRVIDPWGNTPRPIPWDGHTPFVWNGLAITAGSYATQGFKYVPRSGYLLPPSFQFILKGLPGLDYTTDDLIYKPQNLRTHSPAYGFSPVEMIVTTVNIAMRRVASQLEYYREGNVPASFYSLPETWTPDTIQRFQDYFDNMYSGHLGNRRKLRFMPGGSKSSYIPMHEPPLKSEFDEWLTRIVCFAFSYPPTAFLDLSNRSVAEQHDRTGEEEGLQGTKLFVSDLINEVIENEFDHSFEFAWAEEDEVDQSKQSEILMRYAEGGALTINQVRERLGEEPDPNPAANRLMVKTPTGYVPIDLVARDDATTNSATRRDIP